MRWLCALIWLLPAPLSAQIQLELPVGAVETASETTDPGAYALPVGRFGPDSQPVRPLEGLVRLRAWRTPQDRSDTLVILRALRPQILEAGFAPVFECETRACGGFDFRFGTRVLPPPAFEFDLTDFRFLAARRGTGGSSEFLSLLVSRSPRGGFVQLIEVAPPRRDPPALAPPESAEAPRPPGPAPAPEPDRSGRMQLPGVVFESGSARLGEPAIAALLPLARLLEDDPARRVLLVGHSDDRGGLESNIAMSRARARAVRDTLIDRYGIAADRIEAEGAGYLSPIAPNDTEDGRARNRRVEAILRPPPQAE